MRSNTSWCGSRSGRGRPWSAARVCRRHNPGSSINLCIGYLGWPGVRPGGRVSFLASPRKETKRRRPRCHALRVPLRFSKIVAAAASIGKANQVPFRETRPAGSDSPRRNPTIFCDARRGKGRRVVLLYCICSTNICKNTPIPFKAAECVEGDKFACKVGSRPNEGSAERRPPGGCFLWLLSLQKQRK